MGNLVTRLSFLSRQTPLASEPGEGGEGPQAGGTQPRLEERVAGSLQSGSLDLPAMCFVGTAPLFSRFYLI